MDVGFPVSSHKAKYIGSIPIAATQLRLKQKFQGMWQLKFR